MVSKLGVNYIISYQHCLLWRQKIYKLGICDIFHCSAVFENVIFHSLQPTVVIPLPQQTVPFTGHIKTQPRELRL